MELAESVIKAAADGLTQQTRVGLVNLFGRFADKAEVELCAATGVELPVMGARGREPRCVWAPLTATGRKPTIEIDPYLVRDNNCIGTLRNAALDTEALVASRKCGRICWTRWRNTLLHTIDIGYDGLEDRAADCLDRGRAMIRMHHRILSDLCAIASLDLGCNEPLWAEMATTAAETGRVQSP